MQYRVLEGEQQPRGRESRYFSFFGAVQTAPGSRSERLLRRAERRARGIGDELYRARAIQEALEGWGLEAVPLGRDGNLEAWAYPASRRSAVLILAETLGRWYEAGAVRWPLIFTARAAVAGSCCRPRYGLPGR